MPLLTLLIVLHPLSARAQTAGATPTAPKLVAAATSVEFDLTSGGIRDTHGTSGSVTGALVITNQGTAATNGVIVTGYFSDGSTFALRGPASSTNIDINGSASIKLSFPWSPSQLTTGWLVVSDGTRASAPITVPFTIRELVPGEVFGYITGWAAAFALILCLLTYGGFRIWHVPKEADPPVLERIIYPGASWTFTGSLASSLTTLGAVLGTLLAASGFLSDVLPGLATGMFLGVSIGFGLLALLAGVVFTASSNAEGGPTYLALLMAAGITLWAVAGELMTLAILTARGGFPSRWIWAAGVAMTVLVVLYIRRSFVQVLSAPKPDLAKPAGAGGPAALL